ncbi:MAG: T4SS-associated protein EirA [Gammaproteobacteria bacterium]
MTQSIKISLILLASIVAENTVFAQINQAPPAPSIVNFANTKTLQDLCPPLEALTKNRDNTWSAPGGWKSNSPSFINTLDQFIGAQWTGIVVGKINCQYTRKGKNLFPVVLQRPNLTLSPDGGRWTQDLGGYKNCESNDVRQCRFYLPQPPKQVNPYEGLDFFQNKPVEEY